MQVTYLHIVYDFINLCLVDHGYRSVYVYWFVPMLILVYSFFFVHVCGTPGSSAYNPLSFGVGRNRPLHCIHRLQIHLVAQSRYLHAISGDTTITILPTLPRIESKANGSREKHSDFPLPVGRIINTSFPTRKHLTTLCWFSLSEGYPSFRPSRLSTSINRYSHTKSMRANTDWLGTRGWRLYIWVAWCQSE